MISASEPLEFIPRGRQAVEEHPGPLLTKQQIAIPNEHLLLHRLQNVNISSDTDFTEFWSIREIYDDAKDQRKKNNHRFKTSRYITDFYVNSEEELYVKGNTAIWTKGIPTEDSVLPRTCFTCNTPIKFAFFCHENFVKPSDVNQQKHHDSNSQENFNAICLIDSTGLRVYCSTGEDYLSNLEFPILNVWLTKHGIVLEKEPSNTMIQMHSISMPRFFSLSHPLDEMCPILYKSSIGIVNYFTEGDFNIIYSSADDDIIFLYDNKIGKHFLAKLRKATDEEIHVVSCANETATSAFSVSHRSGLHSFGHNLSRHSVFTKSNVSLLGRSSPAINTQYANNPNAVKFGNLDNKIPVNPPNNRTSLQSPLTNLQSSIGAHSISIQDMRKIGQAQPSKPIVPEYCLEHIWTENLISIDFYEAASSAFIHEDLIGESYLCYLLSRSCKLNLIRLDTTNSSKSVMQGDILTLPAKDAVPLNKMKMIVILDPCGTLMLYTGTVLVAKVHIAGVLSTVTPTPSAASSFLNFPRRSSLLPTLRSESPIDDEMLHMLSPVHPLQPQFPSRTGNGCTNLRDPAGNRVTLVYAGGKMFRISLPLINENPFITKCMTAVRQVLKKDLSIQLIVKWYGLRNAPGSQDLSCEQEWITFKNVLSELLGRSTSSNESNVNISSEEPKKRKRDESQSGTNEDWEYLINNSSPKSATDNATDMILHNDCSAPLFSYIPIVFYSLHLLYEDLKLDITMYTYLRYLSEYLYQLAWDMQLQSFCFHYIIDFPELAAFKTCNFFTEEDGKKMHDKHLLTGPVPSIYKQVFNIIKNREISKYPCILNVNQLTKNIIQLISLICHGHKKLKYWFQNIETPSTSGQQKIPSQPISTNSSRSEQVIQMMLIMEIKRSDLERLPVAIQLILSQSLEHSRLSPPIGCCPEAYELLLRSELVAHANFQRFGLAETPTRTDFFKEHSLSIKLSTTPDVFPKSDSAQSSIDGDGMEKMETKLLRLRFPDDLRTTEVRRILNSSEPVLIDITQSPGVSDHEFIEEQEKQLYALCTRTMTLPVGRGMFTMRTTTPTSTESLPIPKLCLSGKEPIKGATIEMQQIEFPQNMNLWPLFHNGVAAGLRISSEAKDIDSTWIVYNKPKGQSDISTEHAGFLMALGLNGHLKTLSFMSIYEYLVKCDEMTSVGLLLGISATHRGTQDIATTKLLSVHIEALLPATALELDIPQNMQVASLMGIGLIYQGSAKRHIAEVLLQEIGRPPGPEMENSVERESYALTAGLALGLVTLGLGESPAGLSDLQLPDTLHYYMVGGNKRPLTGSQKEKYKLPSFQVREGDTVNIDVTAPGATLALGLMFFNTGNTAVAQWMRPPDTSYLLDLIRPDLLLLRIIARGLIMWSKIKASSEWLFSQFPASLEFDLKRGPEDTGTDVDHEANCQAYCNIITGAAFCIGLRFAGTEDPVAFQTLKKTIHMFLAMNGQYVGEYAGKATVESSIILILISLSLVCAGSGNLEILRIIRFLRSRIGPSHPQVTYGSHMGIHMALGFLFLGAGRFTLSRTPEAVAALVCALFPKFPNHSNDNRYHLQAFRHLYVLAVEPRLFLPRDIDTGKLCLCQISCIEIGSSEVRQLPMAPCMLPELSTLKSIKINDPNYWSVTFERNRNWDQLVKVLKNCECIDIKQRAGCLSHLEDPDRLKSLLAQTLTAEQYSCWKIEPKSLLAFSSDSRVKCFTDKFLNLEVCQNDGLGQQEVKRSQLLMIVFYNCLTKDKMHALPIYMALINHLESIKTTPNSLDIWQFKIIRAFLSCNNDDVLVSREIINSIMQTLTSLIESWGNQRALLLKEFISTSHMDIFQRGSSHQLAALITFYDLIPNATNLVDLTGKVNYLRLLYEFKKLNLETDTINCIAKLLHLK